MNDTRLLECSSKTQIEANFERLLKRIDELEARIKQSEKNDKPDKTK